MRKKIQVIGACSCWGAKIRFCEKGPDDLSVAQVFKQWKKEGLLIEEEEMIYPLKRAESGELPLAESDSLIYEFNIRLAERVQGALEKGRFPLVIGGDHANAVGTWTGVERYAAAKGKIPFGLIWIDAHMDAHTPETTPSQRLHGMPVAALMGYGDPRFAHLFQEAPVFEPEYLCLIGVHSFEKGEADLLEKLRVKVYFLEEVQRRGIAVILDEAISSMKRKTAAFGVSLDLDVIDPRDAPGVGSREKRGIRAEEFVAAFSRIGREENLMALEIVEYSPERDSGGKTRELIHRIVRDAFQ